MLVELVDLLASAGRAERGLVEDFELGALRLVELAGLRDGGLLGVGERAILAAGLVVLLPEALHRQLVRALRGVVGHRFAVYLSRGCPRERSSGKLPC